MMSNKPKICIIGDVIVDVTLTPNNREKKVRLGGIIHAARALWALNADYDLLYFAPQYLLDQINQYADALNVRRATCIGNITGAPNLILINDAAELGDQGYELILKEATKCSISTELLSKIVRENQYSDIIIFPGSYELKVVCNQVCGVKSQIHIDIANDVTSIDQIESLGINFQTIISSTSSRLFLNSFNGSLKNFRTSIQGIYCKDLLFKENRGGSRFFKESKPDSAIKIDAQTKQIVHSVGVGDCYNCIYVYLKGSFTTKQALTYASWIAAEYASTTFPDDFKRECQRVLSISANKIENIPGIFICWEDRSRVNIYIAGPDFDFMDTTEINKIADCLTYHNFTPRLPIQENGQMSIDADKDERQMLFASDMKMLDECQILVAVLLDNDPGTLIEIGLAVERKIPVLVYDPKKIANNLMLTELPDLVSDNLDEIICSIFINAAKAIGKWQIK